MEQGQDEDDGGRVCADHHLQRVEQAAVGDAEVRPSSPEDQPDRLQRHLSLQGCHHQCCCVVNLASIIKHAHKRNKPLNPCLSGQLQLKKIKSVFLSKFSYRCPYFQPQLVFQGSLSNPIKFSLGNLFLSRYDGISITHESSPIDWKLKRGLE